MQGSELYFLKSCLTVLKGMGYIALGRCGHRSLGGFPDKVNWEASCKHRKVKGFAVNAGSDTRGSVHQLDAGSEAKSSCLALWALASGWWWMVERPDDILGFLPAHTEKTHTVLNTGKVSTQRGSLKLVEMKSKYLL